MKLSGRILRVYPSRNLRMLFVNERNARTVRIADDADITVNGGAADYSVLQDYMDATLTGGPREFDRVEAFGRLEHDAAD